MHSMRTKKPTMTRRQTQVIKCVADGLSNREIADRLSVNVKTVEGHVRAICDKLGLRRRTRVNIVLKAMALGLARPTRRVADD